jgi:hypothetical protein
MDGAPGRSGLGVQEADPSAALRDDKPKESVAGVVGVAGEDGEGAVELLGEDDAGERVGQGDGAEGE